MIILRTWAKQPGNYFCISSKSPDGTWRDEFFSRKQFKIIPRYIKELDEDDCDIYWCPHGFSKPRRLKRNAVMPYLLWADIDEADPHSMPLKPSVLWESSPGRYAGLWYLNDVLSDDEINKRWTYLIGADKGGWDLTQVLRLPGTRNHKYPKKPIVKLIYEDPRFKYDQKQVEAELPQQRRRKTDDQRVTNARQIFSKYKKHLSGWARREMLSGKPAKGKRSEVFWKLTNELIEAGAEEEEAFTLLWASPWNKFHSRRDGEEQLQREIAKVFDSKFTDNHGLDGFQKESSIHREDETELQNDLLSTIMGTAQQENTKWIHYPYLAAGNITSLEGAPEVGKSWFILAVAAAISNPKVKIPEDGWQQQTDHGMVLYFDAENDIGQAKMRLMDSKMFEDVQNPHDSAPFFHIPPDVFQPNLGDEDIIDEFDALVEQYRNTWKNNGRYSSNVKLIVFDTIQNYSGMTDSNKQGDVVQIMMNLRELAKHFDCSVVCIRHHGKSLKDKDPMHRGVGSIQYAASIRNVLGVYEHPDDPSCRLVTIAKTNLSHKQSVRPLAYSLDKIFPDSMDINKRDRTRITWQGFKDLTDSEIVISQAEKDERRKDKKKDDELLTDILSELEAKHHVNGHPSKIPASEIKFRVENSNIPEIKNLPRELRRLGYTLKGRGRKAYYSREEEV